MADTSKLGRLGEQQACDYLISKGFTVLTRNYRYKRAEIDIIVSKEKLLVFVEVKARSSVDYGEPEQAVTSSKANLIISAADQYIEEINWPYDIRFDIIAVHCKDNWQIWHFEDAFH